MVATSCFFKILYDFVSYLWAMIVVTGAAGFIGSALIGILLERGYGQIVAVDDFSDILKHKNLEHKRLYAKIERKIFFEWLESNIDEIQVILHIGARTNTAEKSQEVLDELNIEFSKRTWDWCIKGNIPFLYASSAATYGSGAQGFNDEDSIDQLEPLNLYGQSKHTFDMWVQKQSTTPPFWAGFKFFNVFGPNEYHKDRMASVIMHAFNQISTTGKMKLFQSHRSEYLNGEQKRDFIYIKDLIDVLLFFMESRKNSGLYNLGTGKARTFKDLALSVFKALEISPKIEYIPIPEDIREAYQYFTEASMVKLKKAGYKGEFTPLEEGTKDYVNSYLKEKAYI